MGICLFICLNLSFLLFFIAASAKSTLLIQVFNLFIKNLRVENILAIINFLFNFIFISLDIYLVCFHIWLQKHNLSTYDYIMMQRQKVNYITISFINRRIKQYQLIKIKLKMILSNPKLGLNKLRISLLRKIQTANKFSYFKTMVQKKNNKKSINILF